MLLIYINMHIGQMLSTYYEKSFMCKMKIKSSACCFIYSFVTWKYVLFLSLIHSQYDDLFCNIAAQLIIE